MSDSARAKAFNRHVASGGKVEATDWMPEEYRRAVCRFVEMHANSELMGVLPEREWILRAPTLKRKLALSAKIQDEVGHAQLLYRVAEDLGKPREAIRRSRAAYQAYFERVVAEGAAAGELVAPDAKLAAVFILSAMNAMAHWYRPDGPLDPDALAGRYAELFLHGLQADDERGP